MNNGHVEFHPVAEIFPLMTGAPFDELVADIKANGLREAIWRHEGKIIDGRNRYNACEAAGVTPAYREWDGTGSLIAFVVSLNIHRRHLSAAQRAMIGARISTRHVGGNVRGIKTVIPVSIPTLEQTAEILNVNKGTISIAKTVRRDADQEVVEAVESGELSLHAARRIAKQPKDKQPAALRARRNGQHHSKTNHRKLPPNRRSSVVVVRDAIGTMVGICSGLNDIELDADQVSPEETEHWRDDLAKVVHAINRLRRQLKERVHV